MHGLVAAVAAVASFAQLPVGNGLGVAVYDGARSRLAMFREHVYAARDAATPTRELMYDTYFGLRSAGVNAWLGGAPVASLGWDGDAGIARVVQRFGGLRATQSYFAPFDVAAPVVVAIVEVTNEGTAPVTDGALFALENLHVGGGSDGTLGESVTWAGGAYEERGDGTRLLLHWPIGGATHHQVTPQNPYTTVAGGGRMTDVAASGVVNDAVPGFEWDLGGLAPGETRTFGLVLAVAADGSRVGLDAALAPLAGKTPAQVLQAARAEWAAFHARARVPAGLSPDERAVYRRQLVVLRTAQVREANGGGARPHGQIVASLPPGKWNIAWLRDQAYAVRALVRAGLLGEARDALDFALGGDAGHWVCCDATGGPYVGAPYALSVVRYFGGGLEEADSDARGPNVELDGFGLTLGALEEYVQASGDTALVDAYAGAIFARTAEVLVGLVEPATGLVRADSSIWETHWESGGRRHYAYTDAAAAWGLGAAARLAARRGDAAAAARYQAASAGIVGAVRARLVDGATGCVRGSTEETSAFLDAAVVELFAWGLFPADDGVARGTFAALRGGLFLEFTGHGYKRNDDGGEYDNREWIVVDLRVAAALRRAGRQAEADALVAWVTAQARANLDLVPENYDPYTAHYAGETPMAGFGAGAYVLALWERADATPPSGAADAGVGSPVDAGASSGIPDSGGGGGGCQVGPAARVPLPWLPLLFLPPALRRRRRRRRSS